MKKKKFIYFVIVFLIIINTCFITFNYLIINNDISGVSEINNSYSKILFGNVYIDSDKDISVKLNDNDMSINVSVKNFNNDFNNELFYFDLINIGNENVSFDGGITNFNSNINSKELSVNIKSDNNIIYGGETKRIYVTYEYFGDKVLDDSYINFNINIKIN